MTPCPVLKRLTDIVLSSVMLIICLPGLLCIATFIKLAGILRPEDRGRIFRQERRFSAGKPFACYKFRFIKQKVLDEAGDVRWVGQSKTLEADKNCTVVGRCLKKWYLDELPQLYNILRGDMSWVGPRPFPVEDYEDDVKRGRVRKQVIRAGLTGLWQIHKGVQTKRSDVEMDNEYVEQCRTLSPMRLWIYDMGILLKTFRVILRGQGI